MVGDVVSMAAGSNLWVLLILLLAVVRVVVSYRAAVRRDAEHTRRIEAALAGTESKHRAEVLGACEPLRPNQGNRSPQV